MNSIPMATEITVDRDYVDNFAVKEFGEDGYPYTYYDDWFADAKGDKYVRALVEGDELSLGTNTIKK